MFSDNNLYKKKWNKNLQWVEKYRPLTINDIVYQKIVINTLKKLLDNNTLSHLLFYGPPGTGKTSTILAAAKQLYSIEKYKDYVLELNASDERGIDIIRNKVKSFAQKTIKNKINFKIVVLDEADSMTTEGQSILRNIIEKYTKITKFCIICNYIDKIIEPIRSRCNIFRFYLLDKKSIKIVLTTIAKKEDIKYNKNILDYIYKLSNGDLRKAITLLQSIYMIYGSKFNINNINNIIGILDENLLNEYIDCIINKIHNIDFICQKINNLGYCNIHIINQIFNKLLIYDINDTQKSNIMLYIYECKVNLLKKCNFYICLLNMSYNIANHLHF